MSAETRASPHAAAGGERVQGCRVTTLCLDGAAAVPVELELQYTGGLMQRIIMTGLTGGAVRESRDRIRGCLDQYGLPAPRRSVLANFAPADLPKEGNGFDLPLALGILVLTGVVEPASLAGRAVVGEIALDGRLRPVRGGLALALQAHRAGYAALMCPRDNAPEAALVRGLRVEGVASLQEALEVLAGVPPPPIAPSPPCMERWLDLADVRGQPSARRALEIAAAGRHNLLLHGPPGTGKTMLAQRLPSLLPPLHEEERLAVTALHGLTAGGATRVLTRPPFRAPHHTVSRVGLIGGGRPIVPGEVSLAHRGVLFLDELPEFGRSMLDALRQPMEDRCVHIARVGRAAVFPAHFQLVAAMNPCPCGYRGHPRQGCTCTPSMLDRYARRLSGPLLDRFDLAVEVPPPSAGEWFDTEPGESSAAVAERVAHARAVLDAAAGRGVSDRADSADDSGPGGAASAGERRDSAPAGDPTGLVGHPPAVRARLERALTSFALSGRSARRLVAVARTIAALDGRHELAVDDLDEALSFRPGRVAP